MIQQALFDGKIAVAISEISDGNMRFFDNGDETEVINNQKKIGKALNLSGDRVARIRTVYDGRKDFTNFNEIMNNNLSKYAIVNSEKQIPISDGLITKCSNIGILLPLADCLGIVVFDEERRVIGLLHSGRQNIEQYGPKKFIEYFIRNFDSNPKKLKIYFSPHAINYKVFKFDNRLLSEAAKEQLTETSVLPKNIIDHKIDTVDNTDLPSHSSGDATQRFAIIVKQNQ